MAPPSNEVLRDRGSMLSAAREFFTARGILEVDTPMLQRSAAVDAHIDLVPATFGGITSCYLQSSPEYAMKRLLAQGCGDIYQLSHVFRDGELGDRHNPEFTMVEWYRLDWTFQEMVDETVAFLQLFLGQLPCKQMTYREALKQHVDIDYLTASPDDLRAYAASLGATDLDQDRDSLLNYILGLAVEPKLGASELTVLVDYPASQAALAQKVQREGEEVAERFEVYYQGVELANGYHELADAQEQRLRLEEANAQRVAMGKKALPIDEDFLQALASGIPDCCGVAVGFDRLMMLRQKASCLDDVIPFSFGA